jgi:hypothetical protein
LSAKTVRVGLLAYGAIGDEHNKAVLATPGMTLTAVCDTNAERLEAALLISPDAKTFADANDMLASGEIDLSCGFHAAKQSLRLGQESTFSRHSRSSRKANGINHRTVR